MTMSSVETEASHQQIISVADQNYLLAALKQTILIRTLEQVAQDFSQTTPPHYMGSAHFCSGQEAVPVGTIAGLEESDQIVATYRGHGWALASGLSLVEVFGEICQRSIGVNGGRGGSAYMMAPWGRFIGENSIVGAGLPIACGVAQANQLLGNGRVIAVSLGCGAFNQGATHEGLAFAAARKLPVLIVCENNGWSEMTLTAETVKVGRIAQRASGYGMPGFTIDGTDLLKIRETVRQAATRARNGDGPVLLECRVPRLWGHYNRDIEHYRSTEDKQAAQERDPIPLNFKRLLDMNLVKEGDLERLFDEAKSIVESASNTVFSSPPVNPVVARNHVWAPMEVEVEAANSGVDLTSNSMSYIQAVNEAIGVELATRPEVIVYGEDVGVAGGIFGASRGLQKKYGQERVFDTPISESAILGSAVGSALMGLKPIVEIMWADFLLVALDQLINQAANVRYITGGRCGVSMVVRTQQGSTPGSCAQHSQCLEALLAHIPGLRIALPATPQDAYNILRSAVANPDPCIIFEARGLYQTTGPVVRSNGIEAIGKADVKRQGSDAIIVTWGTMVRVALEASKLLEQEGLQVAVLDLRWLSPLDETALMQAVRTAKGRVVVAHEANLTGGFGAEIAARIHELLGDEISLKIRRVATPNIRMPAAPVLSQEVLPNAAKLMEAVRDLGAVRSPAKKL
jgi:2-oxoisovalerate dehydrogenase E1 component